MKHKILLGLCLCWLGLDGLAQNANVNTPTQYEVVKSPEEMVDGEDYFITYEHQKKYFAFVENGMGTDSPVEFTYSCKVNNDKLSSPLEEIYKVTSYSNLFRYRRNGDISALIDKKHHAYLANPRNVSGRFSLSEEYTDACKVAFGKGKGFSMTIDGKTIWFATGANAYRLNRLKGEGMEDVTLLHIKYGDKYLQKADGWGGNYYHTVANIHFTCKLTDGIYNTFAAPFHVYDYKTVFGKAVKAYELTALSEGQMTFMEVENDLKANTPYILIGTFEPDMQGMYVAKATQVAYEARDESMKLDGTTVHFVYKEEVDVSGKNVEGKPKTTNVYVLYHDGFHATGGSRNVKVGAYRWYVATEGGQAARQNRLAIRLQTPDDGRKHEGTTAIAPVRPALSDAVGVHDLQGRPVPHPTPGHIYIQNGRKFVCHP